MDNYQNNVINFDKLDRLMDTLYLYKLHPGFELMGNPGGIFTNFTTDAEIKLWFDIVRKLVWRYKSR